MDYLDRQLRQIQENRTPRDTPQSIGDLIRNTTPEELRRAGELSALRTAVDELVDDEFRACCRVVRYAGQRVTIEVTDHARMIQIRMRWAMDLRDQLSRHLRQPVTAIEFRVVSAPPEDRA